MPLHYMEASGLVKHYLRERGSERVSRLLASSTVAVSAIVRVEVASALGRRVREGSLSVEQSDSIFTQFLVDLHELVVIVVGPSVLNEAADLARTAGLDAPLRALDAIHLATAALVFRQGALDGVEMGAFVVSDRQLQRAAMRLGLDVIDPEDPDPNEAGFDA